MVGASYALHSEKVCFVLQKVYREEGRKEAGCSLYAQMPQTIETVFAKELARTQSDVSLMGNEMNIYVDPASKPKRERDLRSGYQSQRDDRSHSMTPPQRRAQCAAGEERSSN